MATPIKETPILYGEDAIRFMKAFNDPNKWNRLSNDDRKRMIDNYNKINAMIDKSNNK